MSEPKPDPTIEARARRGRNIALALGLVLFVVARVLHWGAEVHDDASRFV